MKNNNCILCQSNNKTVIAKQAFKDEYLTLIDPKLNEVTRAWVECDDCNLIYHDPQLEECETKDLYLKFRDSSFRGEVADDYFDRIVSIPESESENHIKAEWISGNISDHIEKKGSVMDIGSGGGVFLHTFLKKNKSWTPYGVEPTPEFANLTKRKLGCSVYTGNYHKDIFDTKFDLITCNHVLEHAIDPTEFLSDIFSDLNRGGYLYMEVPDARDFKDLPPEHDRFLAQHLWYFSENVLEKMFRDAGFKVVTIESHNTIRERKNLVSLLLKE
jgi:SAM-dependent methyltransferase